MVGEQESQRQEPERPHGESRGDGPITGERRRAHKRLRIASGRQARVPSTDFTEGVMEVAKQQEQIFRPN